MKFIDESLKLARDVIIKSTLVCDDGIYSDDVELVNANIPEHDFNSGQNVELLEGYKVIGIAVVESPI